jgi:hypothetical protein
VIQAVFTLGVGLHAAEIREVSDETLVGFLIVIAAAGIAQPLSEIAFERAEEKTRLWEQRVERVLRGTFLALVEWHEDLDWHFVSVNAFLVQTSGLLRSHEHLVRIGRFKIRETAPTGVTWTLGKGVIGRCWKTGQVEGRNVAQDHGPFVEGPAAEWDALPADFRENLTHEELKSLSHLGAVIAAPMPAEGSSEIIGVVSVDVPEDAFDVLWTEATRSLLYSTALQVRDTRRD